MDKILQQELTEILKKLDTITDNYGKKLLDIFCNDFLGSPKKKHLTKDDLELFKIYIQDELGLTLDQKDTKKYSLQNIPEYLLMNSTPPVGSIYTIKGLSKSIGDTQLFNDVNITINYNDKIALIGSNGTGKTTLFRLFAGMDDVDQGEILKCKGLKIGYLSQDFYRRDELLSLREEMESTFPEITKDIKRLDEIGDLMATAGDEIYDLIYEQSDVLERLSMNDGYKKYEMQCEILKYFGFSDHHLDMNINQLSGGEKTKIQIAKFVLQGVDVLLLDEPTNHLDIEGIVFLENFLKKWKKGIVCITHDKTFINSVFQNIRELADGKITSYHGDYDDYMEEKITNMELHEKKYEEQTEYIKKQKEFINKNKARKSKVGAVKTRIKRLEKLERIFKPTDEKKVKNIKIDSKENIPQNVINFSHVDVGYEGMKLFSIRDDLSVYKHDKIGIIGKNGVGKTTLLKSIIGELPPLHGTIDVHGKVKIGYYSQIAEELNFDNDILSELSGINDMNDGQIRNMLASLLIFGDKVYQKISTLSGGERSKVALAKMIMQNPHVLIMDEPTNHLDISSKEAMSNMIIDFSGVALIVSHDRDLLENVSNKIWLIKDKQLRVFNNVDTAFQKI
ncbi:MAG: ABC-F family ATP-binding cassette domain-containing protein [candidate division SR1 bacterium]|nr:ABC-F family ATP-binding cassette domain-containing protein [candidate division SR1 bacterium]